jgi:hypothetical protein
MQIGLWDGFAPIADTLENGTILHIKNLAVRISKYRWLEGHLSAKRGDVELDDVRRKSPNDTHPRVQALRKFVLLVNLFLTYG